MRRIKILDTKTANQIAAGEVVERPVSVVKELLENSLDAGSTRIIIDLLEGGKKQIRVTDNGWGMSFSDLSLAVQRHATSKIDTSADLYRLTTLGFRGEALPSIAAVSKLTICSRTAGNPAGFRIFILDGKPEEPVETGCPVGTTVIVDDLFDNTPARKKFLKSSSTELGYIADLVGRLAMSHPDVSFELIHDGKKQLYTPGGGNLAQAIHAVYGGEIARNMVKIQFSGEINISGFVSRPNLTRSSRHYYNFFLNGRLVKSTELGAILEEAFYTRIPAKRYLVAVIHFNISPELFDVNVHPAKLEVKFNDFSMIKEAFSQALQGVFFSSKEVVPQIDRKPESSKKPLAVQTEIVPFFVSQEKDPAPVLNFPVGHTGLRRENDPMPKEEKNFSEVIPETGSNFPQIRVLGQLDGMYIVAAGPEGLYLIDQHAAHERIRYEEIKKKYWRDASASDILAVPLTVECTTQQVIWLVDNIIQLADLGFVLEHFGGNTFLLRGVPCWNQGGDSVELLFNIMEKLGSENRFFHLDQLVEEELFSMACKSAVKANRHLNESDINFLIRQLAFVENPYTCPHGRPVIIVLTKEEINKRFLRN